MADKTTIGTLIRERDELKARKPSSISEEKLKEIREALDGSTSSRIVSPLDTVRALLDRIDSDAARLEAAETRVRTLESDLSKTADALEMCDVCLRSWNANGGPVLDNEAIVRRARSLLQQGEKDGA